MTHTAKQHRIEVISFDSVDRDLIADLLSRCSIADIDVVRLKQHVDFFVDYCNGIGVKTIVVEHDYIDRDYLEDYAGFYVRCFADYSSTCTRLHFFNFRFTKDSLNNLLLGRNKRLFTTLQQPDNYLGFSVIKPLPRTIIGRTCLKSYPDIGRRFYVTREYKVSFFGIPLTVRNSLAFQEQDHVVAACATSSLWSVFQGTGPLFHHHIPSPVEITQAATQRFPMFERGLPNTGLHDIQIANAIRSVGLDPIPFTIDPKEAELAATTLREISYAYLKCSIPFLLGIRLYGLNRAPGHAIAITGFSLGKAAPSPRGKTGILLRSSRVDELYAHDDGVGPYARMKFTEIDITDPNAKSHVKHLALTTSWQDMNNTTGNIYALPDIILIPAYHKIRIPYSSVLESVISFDSWFEKIAKSGYRIFSERFEWDIYLTTVNSLKREIVDDLRIKGVYRKVILQQSMPRYLWRATAFAGSEKQLDLLFDATDIDQGMFFVRAIDYSNDLGTTYFLKTLAQVPSFTHQNKADPLWIVLRWFFSTPLGK